jgi:hypothetical protein
MYSPPPWAQVKVLPVPIETFFILLFCLEKLLPCEFLVKKKKRAVGTRKPRLSHSSQISSDI